MIRTESVHGIPAIAQDIAYGLRNIRARQLLLTRPGDIGISIEFLKTSSPAHRYEPREKKYWEKLADSFLVSYKLQKDVVREQIQQKLYSLSSYQQAVLVEVLWEYSQGTDRNWWLVDLITKFWQHNKTNEAKAKNFGFFLSHSGVIPRNVRERILSQ